MKKEEKPWTKKCKCGNFIPDHYRCCDFCLAAEYKLIGTYDSCDGEGMRTFYEDEVLAAIRKAEAGSVYKGKGK